jgi:hypothetical protein
METTDSLESLTLFIDFYGNDRETEVAKKSASFWNSEQQKISSFTISNYKEMWIYWRNVLEVPFEYSFEQEQLNIFNSSS